MPHPNAGRVARSGVFVVALYVAVAAASVQLSGRHVRPLFEGVGPSAPYQWVNPPPPFAAGNVHPTPVTSEATLGPRGSGATFAGTPDAQFVVNLPENAIPPRPGDTAADVTISPVDPATLGALPAGSVPDGNAYRFEMAYKPSGQPVDQLAAAGNLVLTVPDPVETILMSLDGKRWDRVESQPVGNATTIGSAIVKPGYYLGAAVPSSSPADTTEKGPRATDAFLVVGVALLAAALVGAPMLLRARRQTRSGPLPTRPDRPAPSARRASRTPPRDRPSGRSRKRKRKR